LIVQQDSFSSICNKLKCTPIHPTDSFADILSLLFFLELVAVIGVLDVVMI